MRDVLEELVRVLTKCLHVLRRSLVDDALPRGVDEEQAVRAVQYLLGNMVLVRVGSAATKGEQIPSVSRLSASSMNGMKPAWFDTIRSPGRTRDRSSFTTGP
jgi:hypothetical protein